MNSPVLIHEPTGIDRCQETVLGGVPLPQGLLDSGGWFKLRRQGGREFTVEGAPAAWWPDGSVKWLHLCGAVDLAGGECNRFALLRAEGSPEGKLELACDESGVRIRGGVLDVDLAGGGRFGLSVRRAGGDRDLLTSPGLSASLTLVGPDGGNSRTLGLEWSPERPEVVVETANRVVLRLPGTFANEEGETAAELVLFLEVLREAPELRLQPVFIYLGEPERDLIASLELNVHSTLASDKCSYRFANERGRGYSDVVQPYEGGPRWPQARQIQLGSTFYKTEKRVGPEGSWTKATEGMRSQGWCHLASAEAGITAAARYFWQEYPRSFHIDSDQGTLTFGLWPKEAEPLDLRRYSPIIYGQPVYEYTPRTAEDGRFPPGMGATGIAKSHELMLHFHEPNAEDAPERGLFFTRPVRVMPDPSHLAETKVVGHLVPTEPARDPRLEAKIAELADFTVQERAVRGWFGQLDFGDILIAYYSEPDRWAYDDGGYAWINTEHLPDLGLWLTALRSGRVDWLEAAIEMSRHNRDVDMYHRGPLLGHGSRHNVNHWGCADKEWRISMPLVRRLHYYLTADPWTAEVMRETVAMFQTYERTAKIAPSMTSSLAGLMVKWEMSGDPADGDVVRNMADLYARAFREDGMMVRDIHADLATGIGDPVGEETIGDYFFMNGFGGQHTLVEVAELLDHGPLSEAIERYVRMCMRESGNIAAVMMFAAHVWRRTGDGTLKDAIRESLDKMNVELVEREEGAGLLDEPRHLALSNMTRRNKIACHVAGEMLHLPPYGMAVLDESG